MLGAGIGIGAAIWAGGSSVLPVPVPARRDATSKDGTPNRTMGLSVYVERKVPNDAQVDVARIWDGWNACVVEDGNQIFGQRITAAQNFVRLQVTNVGSGRCATQDSKMQWLVTVKDPPGQPTGVTADVGVSQLTPDTRVAFCLGTTGPATCRVYIREDSPHELMVTKS